jgi:hypothetical protein
MTARMFWPWLSLGKEFLSINLILPFSETERAYNQLFLSQQFDEPLYVFCGERCHVCCMVKGQGKADM